MRPGDAVWYRRPGGKAHLVDIKALAPDEGGYKRLDLTLHTGKVALDVPHRGDQGPKEPYWFGTWEAAKK